MIKGNSYKLVFSVVVFLIILLVSSSPVIIKTLLVMITIGFLFPIIRKILCKDKCRKLKVALCTSFIFTVGCFVIALFEDHSFDPNEELFSLTIIVLVFSLIGNFVYGLPVSLMAEFISEKLIHFRFWLSGLIHIGFGFGTYLFVPELSVAAMICSIIFFTLDEIFKIHIHRY